MPLWRLGKTQISPPTPAGLNRLLMPYYDVPSEVEAVLIWHSALGAPDADVVRRVLTLPGDVWHAGLRLGMQGLPRALDTVSPTWMLNRDLDPSIEGTSWRMSLWACLLRTEVLRQLGGPHVEFATLAGASLELGHRYVTRGAITRHVPSLLIDAPVFEQPSLPFDDELRFLIYRFGRRWSYWALMRAVFTRRVEPQTMVAAWFRLREIGRPAQPPQYISKGRGTAQETTVARVSVLIPTIDRYPYLQTLLRQLRLQTVKPFEIIIVDQTPVERRDVSLKDDFGDLPLLVLYQDQAGQCSSRNAGLRLAQGDHILFIDDDDEVSPTLIADHLLSLKKYCAHVSSGVVEEVGAGPLPEAFTYTRVSDVFPTNNTLIRKDVLQRSGLFDLAYDRGQRADGDLGMRVYLSGALMILNSDIRVLHHHAPAGGLRTHKARVITYASSRHGLWQRHLPSVTEIYLARRYFSPQQVREMLWLRIFGTFSSHGSRWSRVCKFFIGIALMYDTWRTTRAREQEAAWKMREYPQIPILQNVVTSVANSETEDGESANATHCS